MAPGSGPGTGPGTGPGMGPGTESGMGPDTKSDTGPDMESDMVSSVFMTKQDFERVDYEIHNYPYNNVRSQIGVHVRNKVWNATWEYIFNLLARQITDLVWKKSFDDEGIQ